MFASGLTRSPRYSQVVIKTANLVFHIVVQGSGRREIIVLSDFRAARVVFPIRTITIVICCCRRCLVKGSFYCNKKQREKSLFSFILRVNFMHSKFIISAFKLLLSKPSIYFKKERKKASKNQHCFRALVESQKPDWETPLQFYFICYRHCFIVHINKLLNLRLEVQKKRKNSIILKLSGRESLEPRHSP